MKKIIIAILNANTAYKEAIGTNSGGVVKVYPDVAPQGEQKPYAVYHVVSGTEDQNKEERGVYTRYVQLDHYGVSALQAEDLEEKAIEALNRYKGTVSDIEVQSIRVQSSNSNFSDDIEVYGSSSEFKIMIEP